MISQKRCSDQSNYLCMFQHSGWVQCLWFLRKDVLISQMTFACMFQYSGWVQCLWFLRKDVLISQMTFACSNIASECSASDFFGGGEGSDQSNNLCMFQHRMWVQCLWFLGEGVFISQMTFTFFNIACECSVSDSQKGCSDQLNDLCMFQHRLWVQCLWFLGKDVLISQMTFACSNIACECSASDFSGKIF